jgi:hypothetical protein
MKMHERLNSKNYSYESKDGKDWRVQFADLDFALTLIKMK